MGLEVSPGRPLARLVARAMTDAPPSRRVSRRPYAPPAATFTRDRNRVGAPASQVCERILRALLVGDDLTALEDRLAPDMVAWSPHLFTMSRDQLLIALHDDELGGDTLTEVTVDVTNTDASPPRVYVEWRLTGRFTNPGFIEDDLLLEPTGRLVETAGVLVVAFEDDRVVWVHCYYDDLALLEQLVAT